VADDETDQSATTDAFAVLYTIAEKRLAARRLTVIDATNLRAEDRKAGIALARRFHALPVAIVLNVPAEVGIARNAQRENRRFGARVVHEHTRMLRKSLGNLRREGYRVVHIVDGVEAVDAFSIVREPLYNDKRTDHGPFDIIGDVHGCYDELVTLLTRLGYVRADASTEFVLHHPAGRRAIFLGDLVDRGPNVVGVLRLVMAMVAAGSALCVPGNHERKLSRKLAGKPVTVSHGLAETLMQIDALPQPEREAFIAQTQSFIESLVSHYWLDEGKLVVAHAGLRAGMHGRGSAEVREFALYGETTGETDEFGLPVRYDWASEYRSPTVVVYGHTPVPRAQWVNNTICIDTGCVYGGALTALRYPEREIVDVRANRTYVEPVRPLSVSSTVDVPDDTERSGLLNIDDVGGKRRIETRYAHTVTIPAENAAAALEVMSRFAIDPRWLIYLPPTMSPTETSRLPMLLEHPDEAFRYFQRAGVARVVLEEKHMGSRAITVIARDENAAAARFGVSAGAGVIYTRTGRPFFGPGEHELESALLARIRAALDATDFWARFATDWVCLDAELMPWSVKAQTLIDTQYGPVGEAAVGGLRAGVAALSATAQRGIDTAALSEAFASRAAAARAYVDAYRRYVRPVTSVDDLAFAAFHILATENVVHTDRDHVWHMETIAQFCAHDPRLLLATRYRVVELADAEQVADAVAWWETLTEGGGEGMVVKPYAFVTQAARGLVQPALKVRGREYLRIIYGPEYTLPNQIERLRERNVAGKRRLALQEFTLGLEALHRFVERAPLRSIHECVFAVLALESEPIDPRL
jgi:protein phosphatase